MLAIATVTQQGQAHKYLVDVNDTLMAGRLNYLRAVESAEAQARAAGIKLTLWSVDIDWIETHAAAFL